MLKNKRNKPINLINWSIDTLANSTLDKRLCMELLIVAQKSIRARGLRGNISDAWKNYSDQVSTITVPDLYV